MVEIAHHGNPRRGRRPDREGDAGHAPHLPRLGPQLVEDAVLVALVEQVQVLLAQRGQKTVGIGELPDFPTRIGRSQLVAENSAASGDEGLENVPRAARGCISGGAVPSAATTSQEIAPRAGGPARPVRSTRALRCAACMPRTECGSAHRPSNSGWRSGLVSAIGRRVYLRRRFFQAVAGLIGDSALPGGDTRFWLRL